MSVQSAHTDESSPRQGIRVRAGTLIPGVTHHVGNQIRMGKLILYESRKQPTAKNSRSQHRLREIECVIKSRYGCGIPFTDDADVFIFAVAHAYKAEGEISHVERMLTGWCGTWAPWALTGSCPALENALTAVKHRNYDLSQFDVGKLLAVRWEERQQLGLRTIAAFDISPARQKQLAKDRKRELDRQRAKAKRRAKGRKARSKYLAEAKSNTRPWEAAGMSRRTWYRRQKEGGTSSSRTEVLHSNSDTPVPNDLLCENLSRTRFSFQSPSTRTHLNFSVENNDATHGPDREDPLILAPTNSNFSASKTRVQMSIGKEQIFSLHKRQDYMRNLHEHSVI